MLSGEPSEARTHHIPASTNSKPRPLQIDGSVLTLAAEGTLIEKIRQRLDAV
jgi:hypothetical protein